jgi:hypothetical protein
MPAIWSRAVLNVVVVVMLGSGGRAGNFVVVWLHIVPEQLNAGKVQCWSPAWTPAAFSPRYRAFDGVLEDQVYDLFDALAELE